MKIIKLKRELQSDYGKNNKIFIVSLYIIEWEKGKKGRSMVF